jgi:hypothetical protein
MIGRASIQTIRVATNCAYVWGKRSLCEGSIVKMHDNRDMQFPRWSRTYTIMKAIRCLCGLRFATGKGPMTLDVDLEDMNIL